MNGHERGAAAMAGGASEHLCPAPRRITLLPVPVRALPGWGQRVADWARQ